MKTLSLYWLGCLVFSSTVFAAPDGYVDPITFDGSDAQKNSSHSTSSRNHQLHQEAKASDNARQRYLRMNGRGAA